MSRGDYIRVIDGEVRGYPTSLPMNWGDVSNFFALSDDELKRYGWYPVRVIPPNVKDSNDVIERAIFHLDGDEVIQTHEIRKKTESEIEKELEQKWEDIRNKRDYILSSTDWTQLNDAPLTEIEREAWAVYRQALRDMTESVESIDDIQWPELPQSKHSTKLSRV